MVKQRFYKIAQAQNTPQHTDQSYYCIRVRIIVLCSYRDEKSPNLKHAITNHQERESVANEVQNNPTVSSCESKLLLNLLNIFDHDLTKFWQKLELHKYQDVGA